MNGVLSRAPRDDLGRRSPASPCVGGGRRRMTTPPNSLQQKLASINIIWFIRGISLLSASSKRNGIHLSNKRLLRLRGALDRGLLRLRDFIVRRRFMCRRQSWHHHGLLHCLFVAMPATRSGWGADVNRPTKRLALIPYPVLTCAGA